MNPKTHYRIACILSYWKIRDYRDHARMVVGFTCT